MNSNKIYSTQQIVKYFSKNRVQWDQLYNSEKIIIEKLNINSDSRILDVGCACGGLGLILNKKYHSNNYVGLEINKQAFDYAKNLYSKGKYFNTDGVVFINDKSILKKKHSICQDYHINRCDGPCEGLVSFQKYNTMIKLIIQFLQ